MRRPRGGRGSHRIGRAGQLAAEAGGSMSRRRRETEGGGSEICGWRVGAPGAPRPCSWWRRPTEEESRGRERVAVGKRREGWARVRGW
jgi:hypothetical protein